MIDHIGFAVSDLTWSKAFYEEALEPLGITMIMASTRLSAACTWADVEAFHAAALAAGGTDNCAPGRRTHYHRGCYGAFVGDPGGSNIEVGRHRQK